jgi:hypothetical protein
MKGATSGRINRRRQFSLQRRFLTALNRAGRGNSGNESLCIRMFWVPNNFSRRAGFDNLSQVHDQYAVGDVLNNCKVMRNEKIRQSEARLQFLQEVHDLRLHRNVKRADWLIADDEFRLDRQGARDANSLPLSAAEFVRVSLRMGGVESNLDKQFFDTRPPRRLTNREMVNIQSFPDDLLDGHSRIQGAERVLKNHLEVPPAGAKFLFRKREKICAFKPHLPCRRIQEPNRGAAERRFATAAFAHQPDGLARSDLQGDVIDRFDNSAGASKNPVTHREMDFQVLQLQQRLHSDSKGGVNCQ